MFVPALPALDPGALLRRLPLPEPSRFPLNAGRSRWYFYCRNAVWQGVAALGLRPGDEVLMPALDHGAEVGALLDRELALRFYPVDASLRYDLDEMKALLSPRTRAVYVIHYLGVPQPVGELRRFCDDAGLFLIEDCALSLFASAAGVTVGTVGEISVFSLHKSLAVPHGGLLVMNAGAIPLPLEAPPPPFFSSASGLASRGLAWLAGRDPVVARALDLTVEPARRRWQALSDGWRSHCGQEEFDPSKARLGASALARRLALATDASAVVERRRANYARLARALPAERLVWPELPDGACPLFLPLLVSDKERAVRFLSARGVEAVPFWAVPHPAVPAHSFPAAGYLRAHLLEVPCHQGLAERQVRRAESALAALLAVDPPPPPPPLRRPLEAALLAR
jgi:dTDP-4-amino-4,6-dideoxygalactose transaminase